jgi:hypothetical protein
MILLILNMFFACGDKENDTASEAVISDSAETAETSE